MNCPHKMRADLPTDIPETMRKLPLDDRGYPVPWFVMWINGKPEFRSADGAKWTLAIAQRLCWVCGEKIKGPKAFVIGPMCAINRTTSEPPCHIDCAEWSVRACPFMVKPQMVRRRKEGGEFEEKWEKEGEIAGVGLDRNPGASCIWITNLYKVFRDPKGGKLIHLGVPQKVTWWAEGRTATRAEIDHSIQTGLPLLRQYCYGAAELAELERRERWVYSNLLP